jgi:cytochrome P450
MDRQRRSATPGRLDPFFSRRNVLKLEYLVQARAEKLLKIMTSRFSHNEAVDLHHTFRSISVDVILDYAFGKSYELMSRYDLGREFFDLTGGLGPSWWVFQQWPAIQAFALSLPPSVAKKMNKSLKHILPLMEVFELYNFPHLVIDAMRC